MARPEEEHIVKAMKKAKTGEEMMKSWYTQRPGASEAGAEAQATPLHFWAKRKPEMISTYAHNQLMQLLDRGILEPKTRYLIILACYMMEGCWRGILPQMCNAKAAGATEEEIMETAFLACYAVSKDKMVYTGQALNEVFNNPIFKNTKPLAEE